MSLQNFCNPFPCDRRFQKLTTKSGSKQIFSLLQKKVVIQAVCLRIQAVSLKARFLTERKGYRYLGKVKKFQQPHTNAF